MTQFSNSLFGEQKAERDAAKTAIGLIKVLVDDIDADCTDGRSSLFDNDRWSADTEFFMPSKDVGVVYLPFDCGATHLAKSNGCGAHLVRWSREDIGIRCSSSYDTHVFTLSNENSQSRFKPTGEKICINDLTHHLYLDNKEKI